MSFILSRFRFLSSLITPLAIALNAIPIFVLVAVLVGRLVSGIVQRRSQVTVAQRQVRELDEHVGRESKHLVEHLLHVGRLVVDGEGGQKADGRGGSTHVSKCSAGKTRGNAPVTPSSR